MNWFIEGDGTQRGPFPASYLKQLAVSGGIQRSDLVRREDQQQAVPAERIKGLFSDPAVSAPIAYVSQLKSIDLQKVAALDLALKGPPPLPPSSPKGKAKRSVGVAVAVVLGVLFINQILPSLSSVRPARQTAPPTAPSSEVAENTPRPMVGKDPAPSASVNEQPADPPTASSDCIAIAPRTGPHGEKLQVGGNGPGTAWYFHYYLDEKGEKVMHGTAHLPGRETIYYRGDIVSRKVFDHDKLTSEYTRKSGSLYDHDLYVYGLEGSVTKLRFTVEIIRKNNTEKIRRVAGPISTKRPLTAPLGGRPLESVVRTAGSDKMPWWIRQNLNPSIKALECFAYDEQLVIDFDIDEGLWKQMSAGITLPLLVRLLDENGQYLSHFITTDGFTTSPEVFEKQKAHYVTAVKNGYLVAVEKRNAKATDVASPFLLEPNGNRLVYPINPGILGKVAKVEVGFFAYPR
jgi:hypothetical protein